ncbi:SMP-30/gluconolactonase/LRE family protein [Sphingobium sp. AN641]|uniref:SMP-30/gluconolactonase/LRE family protein n=1 Tax=Sphingobium sp. AN641 TaxID=3133443 RepID=UPI0030C2ECF4
MNKVQASIGGLFVGLLGLAGSAISAKPAMETCPSSGDLKFLCGIQIPEDLAVLQGGRWIITSGAARGSGLHLVDGATKRWQRWIAPAGAKARAPFDQCKVQPAPDDLVIDGINLRQNGRRHATLYAVNHGGASRGVGERIEVFDIDMAQDKPTLTWAGCLPWSGKLEGNAVVAASDGTVYATVMNHPGYSVRDWWTGVPKPTGAVYKWTPGSPAFERMAGTDLVGNNGIEVSPDGKTLYVASMSAITIGDGTITSFSTTNPARKLRSIEVKGSLLDNIHWVNGRLMSGGPRTDTCPAAADGTPCVDGYHVEVVNPKTLAVTFLTRRPANPQFSGVSFGLPVGKTLWLGSFTANKLAYRPMP